ncbi:MAG TPA: VOC family protein [Thermomicrobiaceae bacterium]|nr:VOC family protein [Thermomicrobiaceae bacterium]
MSMKIHSATVVVNDLDAAIDFYVNTLGWTKDIDQPMGPNERFVTVVPPGGGAELALGYPSWFGFDAARGGMTGISLTTDDIEADYDTLSQRGVRFKGPIETMPWGDRATWFYDLDGNEFYLIQNA